MRAVLFNRWAKSSSFTASEIQVLEKLVPQDSPEAFALLSQAKQAPYVVRKVIENSGYEATIPYLEDDSLLIEAEESIVSPSVETDDSRSGRRLRFSTAVLRGGFLLGLRGTAVDGNAWPRKWCAGSEVTQAKEIFTWLDTITPLMEPETASAVLIKLIDWSNADRGRVSEHRQHSIRFALPASEDEVVQCEARLRTTLPDQYKEFVTIVNGIGIRRGRPYEILGTDDLEYLDDSRQWIGVTPLYEDGYVALRNEDKSANCYLLTADGCTNKIGDLRQHVRDSLEWMEESKWGLKRDRSNY